ncbi:MAG: Gfo/Idh/MocA family protein, partial [Planctomycetota bacterium]
MSERQSSKPLSRRKFIRGLGAAAAITVAGGSGPRAAGANERLGVGFIGCGGRSHAHLKSVHWLKTQANEPVELVAACDAYRPRMQKVAEQYNVKGYMDHRELLADPNVDIVCISTCDHHHGYQAIDA